MGPIYVLWKVPKVGIMYILGAIGYHVGKHLAHTWDPNETPVQEPSSL